MWILLPKAPASKPPCYFSTKPLSAGGQPAQRCLKAQEEKTAASITQWGQRSPSHVPTALGVTSIHQMGLVCSPQQHCSTSPEEAVVEQEDASQQDQVGKGAARPMSPQSLRSTSSCRGTDVSALSAKPQIFQGTARRTLQLWVPTCGARWRARRIAVEMRCSKAAQWCSHLQT